MVPRNGRVGIGRIVAIGLVVVILVVVALGAAVLTGGGGAKPSTSTGTPTTTSATQPVLVCGATITADTVLSASIGPCSGNGLFIGANGITLDCAGHSISGTGTNDTSVGIHLAGMTSVTVMNCYVTEFSYGLVLNDSSGSTLSGNRADNNTYDGFLLDSASNGNLLSGNTANNNSLGDGFYLRDSSNNTLSGNTADSNHNIGFVLDGSSSNTFTNDTANSNYYEYGFYLYNSSGNTLSRNTADSNRAYGYYDTSTGSGTAGTANLYTDNISAGNGAGGSKPRGLDSPQY
ncbi:MAG: right-handed parallel beta-helix repeat-containing protein [Nitrososphaerales archaeon]